MGTYVGPRVTYLENLLRKGLRITEGGTFHGMFESLTHNHWQGVLPICDCNSIMVLKIPPDVNKYLKSSIGRRDH